MDLYVSIVYLVSFVLLFPVCLLIFFKSNMHKIFKQGETNTIRLFYIFLAIGLDFLVTSGITKAMEAIITIISK